MEPCQMRSEICGGLLGETSVSETDGNQGISSVLKGILKEDVSVRLLILP